jgi:hypothetical protein
MHGRESKNVRREYVKKNMTHKKIADVPNMACLASGTSGYLSGGFPPDLDFE